MRAPGPPQQHEQRPRSERPETHCGDESALTAGTLQLDSVGKAFGVRRVLNGVSLGMRQRDVLALCGASGCGKTTLIRIICGLIPFDAGHLTIGDTTVRAGTPYPAELYGKIGVVFQEHSLFPHLTAIANVTLALREFKRLSPRHANERGMAELERMGVASLAQRYPATLSGGEKQRIAMARALAMDPLLLLLDEPTANLDPERVGEVRERVLELANAGTTMLLVTHNLEFARLVAKSFALLQNGTCHYSDDPGILDGLRNPR
jgi:ABC-type polar amino acid transport system ATPase subunit